LQPPLNVEKHVGIIKVGKLTSTNAANKKTIEYLKLVFIAKLENL
jgi:hypothetical protein